jgi:methyl-accepting chemotaxis protein
VANEVKDLAHQTAEATQMIASQIDEIATHAQAVQQVTSAFTEIMRRISGLNEEIASSVDEQSVASGAITQSINTVASAGQEVVRNAQEMEFGIQEVARAVSEVALGAQEIARSSAESATAAKAVSAKSDDAKRFILSILESAQRTRRVSSEGRVDRARDLAAYIQGAVAHFSRLTDVVEDTARNLSAAQAGLDVGPALFDAPAGKKQHLEMMARMEMSIHGRLASQDADVPDAAHCSFISASGLEQMHGNPALAQEIRRLHEAFHQSAQVVLDHIAAGDREKASVAMKSLDGMRRQFFGLVDRGYVDGHPEGETRAT